MKTTITYLFDPLCGWCYGAAPAIQRLNQQDDISLELAPTGLFADRGGRIMDAAFADYAWSNDIRIEKLTGQRFTEDYRLHILGKTGSRFDSAAATLALTAVFLTEPAREAEMLKVLQEARYIHAQDTCDFATVETLLRQTRLNAAADRLVIADDTLRESNFARIQKAQQMMHTFGAQGVPTIVITDMKGSRLLNSHLLYSDFDDLLSHIAAA